MSFRFSRSRQGPSATWTVDYCYYLDKQRLYPQGESFRMPDELLEEYIVQHIDACTEPEISFSWHGGEPTILGLDYFRKIVTLQQKHQPAGRRIVNGIQTNGTLLDDDWCRFLAAERLRGRDQPGRSGGHARPLPPDERRPAGP